MRIIDDSILDSCVYTEIQNIDYCKPFYLKVHYGYFGIKINKISNENFECILINEDLIFKINLNCQTIVYQLN